MRLERRRGRAARGRLWALVPWALVSSALAAGFTLSGCGLWEPPPPQAEGLRAHTFALHVAHSARAVVAQMDAAAPAPVDWGARYGRAGVALSQRLRVEVAERPQDALTLWREARWGDDASDAWLEERAQRGDGPAVAASLARRHGMWWRGEVVVSQGEATWAEALGTWDALTCAASGTGHRAQHSTKPSAATSCAYAPRLMPWLAARGALAQVVTVASATPSPEAVARGEAIAWRRLVLDIAWHADDPTLGATAARVTFEETYRPTPWAAPLLTLPNAVTAPPPGWPRVRRLLMDTLGAGP